MEFTGGNPGGRYVCCTRGCECRFLKPSPVTWQCEVLLAECAWEAGVPRDVLQFMYTSEKDVGREFVMHSDGVILTGSLRIARMFQWWKNDIRLFAEVLEVQSKIGRRIVT